MEELKCVSYKITFIYLKNKDRFVLVDVHKDEKRSCMVAARSPKIHIRKRGLLSVDFQIRNEY